MYAEGNVTSGKVHVIKLVRIKLASTWKILRLLMLAANEKPTHEIERHNLPATTAQPGVAIIASAS